MIYYNLLFLVLYSNPHRNKQIRTQIRTQMNVTYNYCMFYLKILSNCLLPPLTTKEQPYDINISISISIRITNSIVGRHRPLLILFKIFVFVNLNH